MLTSIDSNDYFDQSPHDTLKYDAGSRKKVNYKSYPKLEFEVLIRSNKRNGKATRFERQFT